MNAGLNAVFLKAKRAEQRGEDAEARRLLEEVLKKYPNNKTAAGGLARLDEMSTGSDPRSQAALDEILRLYALGDFAGAIVKGEAIAHRFAASPDFANLLGAAHLDRGDLAKAQHAFLQALQIDPDHRASRDNLVLLRQRQGNQPDAEAMYREAVTLDPGHAEVHCQLASFYLEQDRHAEAEAAFEATLALDPDNVGAHHGLAKIRLAAKHHAEAIDLYLRAIALQPDHFDSVFGLAHAFWDMGKRAEAVDVYHQATMVSPDSCQAHFRLADVLRVANVMDRSHAAYIRALELKPDSRSIKAQLLYHEAVICDWHARHEFRDLPFDALTKADVVQPFTALPFEDDGARQLARSQLMVDTSLQPVLPRFDFPRARDGEKIRIGYFSADFHDHATLHLMGGLLREHDRARFEIRAYSFGHEDDAKRQAILPLVDAFIPIQDLTDAQAVERARADRLDIAVDLKGYTANTRMNLFAERVAPVQIAWLGYPGTVGGDFMDYIIADSVVIPHGSEHHYSEKVIRLPGSYQANDNRRAIGACPDDRTALGLPAAGFVFCCFNQNYKIGPAEFDIWMRLLKQVEGSVLWLIRSNALVEANLRKEAIRRGVRPERLVFADKAPHADHLARHRHADLFLDTFAVNAHTTASDSLWGGLPVLTLAGEQFAARVAASLLAAIDLPDLITHTAADYEARALELARSPEKLAEVRARLAANRLTTPLFDTVAHTRQIEAAYTATHQRHRDGLAPDHMLLG
ncbi:tetratricopeptide repeat protein [Sphingobium sufflavum]|uniref:tetratricopeptide repeat protein n=1 Tax=Sphingobium sufflavum TaxID=1129547 RepID=UPI001F213A2D|nr:tetratricopeptide repeat protein [Sphingobium sufflavum]MCE7795619.1 tetratricopeptide repeat protein [Sphingobium sufflavum]